MLAALSQGTQQRIDVRRSRAAAFRRALFCLGGDTSLPRSMSAGAEGEGAPPVQRRVVLDCGDLVACLFETDLADDDNRAGGSDAEKQPEHMVPVWHEGTVFSARGPGHWKIAFRDGCLETVPVGVGSRRLFRAGVACPTWRGLTTRSAVHHSARLFLAASRRAGRRRCLRIHQWRQSACWGCA